jgi:hypothetical protein
MTATPLPTNRFELLPDDADDAVAQIPVPLEEGELDLPPLSQPKYTALLQADFQLRERAMFVDIASLPSEAMIQLAITRKYTDHTLAANAMRAADKAWGGNGDLERILGYQARYSHVHQWPLPPRTRLQQFWQKQTRASTPRRRLPPTTSGPLLLESPLGLLLRSYRTTWSGQRFLHRLPHSLHPRGT